MKLSCPRIPEHARFAVTVVERVDHELSISGDYVDDVRNTYEGATWEAEPYCLDCAKDHTYDGPRILAVDTEAS